MNKKIIIAFLAVILVAGVLLFYRSDKKTQVAMEDRVQAFEKLSDVTKRVPRAGLTQMGMAINKYYEKNGAYPSDLMELYPEYIPLASFIEDIDWYYEPQKDDFYLSKSIIRGTRELTAFIDRDLAPSMGEATAVATVARASRPETSPEPSIDLAERFALPERPAIRPIAPGFVERETVSIIKRPQIVSVVEGDIGLGISPDISSSVFVWRDAGGALGFGNMTYPKRSKLSIYKNHAWVNIKTPDPRHGDAERSGSETAGVKKDPETVASSHSRNYLVWKDKNGVIGYGDGNAQGPDMENLSSVCINGSWVNVKKSTEPAASSRGEAPKPESAEEIAARYSGSYLIWKDKNGVIGYGNAQGPGMENIAAVCIAGEWMAVEAVYPKREKVIRTERKPFEMDQSSEAVASRYSDRFLIWKDKNGVIGYGNIQEPGFENISAVCVDGKWIKMNAPLPAQRKMSEPIILAQEERKDPDTVASDYSNTYLIWKDKKGAIGYGNVQYPGEKEIEYICVNGNWQKVAN